MSETPQEPQEPQEPAETPPAPEPDSPQEPAPDEPAPDEQEPDEPTEEPEPEPELEPPAEPQGLSDRDREERFKKADKAVQAYARRIGDIFEEEAQNLTPCPLCPDIHKGFVNLHDAGRIPDDVKNAAMMFLGYARERDYAQSPAHQACPDCQAQGKVATGSQVPGKETITCPRCQGNGYVGPQAATGNGHVETLTGPLAPPLEPTGAGVPDIDPSGEPRLLPDGRENPNYGKWPQYKIAVEPWGVTAGLNAQDAVPA